MATAAMNAILKAIRAEAGTTHQTVLSGNRSPFANVIMDQLKKVKS